MWAQLTPFMQELARRVGRALAAAGVLIVRGVSTAWRFVRPYLVFALNVVVALILLFEEWGWRPLSNLLAQLTRFRVWAQTELWIAGLPPYGALVALGVPSAVLIPAKLFGVYLLALGHVVSAGVVLALAKLASTALIARIFLLTKPALMQIGWFQRAYEVFVPWQEALFAWIRSSWIWRYGRVVKWRVGGFLRRKWKLLRPQLAATWASLKPRALALGRRLQGTARQYWQRTSLAGERLLRRLQGPGE